ncbi:hypothetical protein LC653_17360 [Nostoc sp. CHAB 5784]|uniref:hypothetical protein n=1 Tax=Nostoc mirabile TaxID=2907820 RepID=UPI001E464480|nr:hypothetical protein [Nostoc mirabile]MCC5665639.1 hypothetical protein [Nostoc mirabile CHAB5784]
MITKEIILLSQQSKANYEGTVNLVAEYYPALNIKIINKSDQIQLEEALIFSKNTLWSKCKCSSS